MSATFEGWMTGLAFTTLFIVVFGIVVIGMNTKYGESYSIEGLNTDSLQSSFDNIHSSLDSKLTSGEAQVDASDGLSFTALWDMIKSLSAVILSFAGGGWVITITGFLNLPDIVGSILMGVYILTIFLIILKILTKR